MLLIDGTGLTISMVTPFDCPPDAPFTTSIPAVPVLATSWARIVALTCELLTKFVLRSEVFQRTFELEVKPLPVRVMVKDGLPAKAFAGLTLAMAGGGVEAIVSGFEFEVPTKVSPQKVPMTLRNTCCAAVMKVLGALKVSEKTPFTGEPPVPIRVRVAFCSPCQFTTRPLGLRESIGGSFGSGLLYWRRRVTVVFPEPAGIDSGMTSSRL
jgi:hypothetical protein